MKRIRVAFERKAEIWLTGHIDIEVDDDTEDSVVENQAEPC